MEQRVAVTPAVCRNTLGLFATGVTVITTVDPVSGEPRGMTANAFMSVSLTPPLVLVSVRRGARLHELIEESGRYAVSVLGADLETEARRFAGMEVAPSTLPPRFDVHHAMPVLRDALAWLVAAVVDARAVGDHMLFVGEIVDLGSERPEEPPLGFYRSTFARVTSLAGRVPVPLEPWDHPIGLWG